MPGNRVADAASSSRQFVRDEAWGHHASCTCAIGPDGDPRAVLDSHFRVRGTSGLRVVDASVFPRIPGFFIVTAVYMAAEKASDALLADAAGERAAPVRLVDAARRAARALPVPVPGSRLPRLPRPRAAHPAPSVPPTRRPSSTRDAGVPMTQETR